MTLCEVCHEPIPFERLSALPGTTTCVRHSGAIKRIGLMDYGHKTAPSLVVLDPTNKEALRLARRVFNRSR